VKTFYLFFLKEKFRKQYIEMTKKDLVAKLAKLGMQVDADKFDIPKLKKMLLLLDDDQPKKKEKKEKKERAPAKPKRPDNVAEVEVEKKPDESNVAPGKYIVSFNLQLHVKERGYHTKMVTKEYEVSEDETAAEIARSIAEDFITSNDQFLHNYDDSDVDIMGITKVRFTEKKDVNMLGVKAKAGHPLQYKMFPADLHINKNEGECVLDMIIVAANKAWPLFSRQKLIEELTQLAEDNEKDFLTEGVCPRHLMAWAASRKRVTCIALNPFGNTLDKVIAARTSR